MAEEAACLPHHLYVPALDGWWCGEEGPVHGECEDAESCPHPPSLAEPPCHAAARYPEALPGDTLLVYVSCHL